MTNARTDHELEAALRAATYGGARSLGLADYGLTPGSRADLVVVDTTSAAEAVATHPARYLIMTSGRILASPTDEALHLPTVLAQPQRGRPHDDVPGIRRDVPSEPPFPARNRCCVTRTL